MAKKKTKAEELQDAVAEAVGAGRELHLESVDFSDPNRPKTCLEVDFPILPINHVATIEGNAGKPIYQMSKWWARRRSSVFRAMLIAAATKAPDDEAEAAKLVWDSYYGNHQKNEAFRKLKVADIFMGGGTTIVEGSRLGMQMYGNDINPVAWLVVKNEMAQVDPEEVKKLLDAIEAEVKPQIMPFYACDCPRGHKGKWTHKRTGKVMGADFDALALTQEQRPEYSYEGPEIIYTFWAKHGPCQATDCNHRTPIMSSPVIAVKELTVKAWTDRECSACGKKYDIEKKDARMAPASMFVVADTVTPYAVMDDSGNYACPHCGNKCHDPIAASKRKSASLGNSKNKKIKLTLLIHPDWMKGSRGKATDGKWFGGSVTDTAEATAAWNDERAKFLKLIEVRGELQESISCPDTGDLLYTDQRGGTVPRKSVFACQEATCGTEADVLKSIERSGKTSPIAAYCMQGHCPTCDSDDDPYRGRFFAVPSASVLNNAEISLHGELGRFNSTHVPENSVPKGLETSVRTPLHKYQYKRWGDFFNSRQKLVHIAILRAITTCDASHEARLVCIGALQQYLRTQNMFCIWNIQADKLEPFLSKNNFQPPARPVENGVFNRLGRGNWTSCADVALEGLNWSRSPYEVVAVENLRQVFPQIASDCGNAKSVKTATKDPLLDRADLTCGSSTALPNVPSTSIDLVVTDPPFGDIMQYSELSGFFYPWLRSALLPLGEAKFEAEQPPTALEAVDNAHRHGKDGAVFYKRLLTECWREAARILKPSGLLSFTFHHDKDGPWVAVLESLFDAGFYLEATIPIRSDETKGEGSKPGTFGAQKVEFDIVHVCRKRLEEPDPISWARLRRQIMQDVRQLREIIEQHQKEGLGEADLQVIRRGKALEYYSRHYGKVYIEKGRESEFTVKDALLGINQLLEDESDTSSEAPPVTAEPYTRQFLRLFADKSTLDRDQMQKYLRGTSVSPSEFLERGWCSEEKKVFTITPPSEWAQQWKGKARKAMSRDFDQSYFLIGACYDESGIKVSDTLDSGGFAPHPAIPDLLDWFGKHGSDTDMKAAARRAKQIYSAWLAKNTKEIMVQHTLFDLENE
jgi:putative DNA methylase